jgi:hypothetical protein
MLKTLCKIDGEHDLSGTYIIWSDLTFPIDAGIGPVKLLLLNILATVTESSDILWWQK